MGLVRNEQRLIQYLNETIQRDIGKDLDVYDWKLLARVENPDVFYDLTQRLNISELQSIGGLHFLLQIPESPASTWTIAISSRARKKFLDEHGDEYKII